VARLYIDDSLSSLAQNYSSTLIQQQFLSHTDKQGNTPNMRAKAAGILEAVAENLAVNSNLTQAQLCLQRSPAHLRTLVDPKWTRVGLGIVQNSNQLYYLTEEFSSRDMELYPLTSSELAQLQRSVLNYIQNEFPSLKTENKQLSSDLSSYQQSQSSDVVGYLSGQGYHNFDVDEVSVGYNGGDIVGELAGKSYFQPGKSHSNVGVAVIYKGGKIVIDAAYN
jgi:hypothetical protein